MLLRKQREEKKANVKGRQTAVNVIVGVRERHTAAKTQQLMRCHTYSGGPLSHTQTQGITYSGGTLSNTRTYTSGESLSNTKTHAMQPNISGDPLSEKDKNDDCVHTLVRKRKPLSDSERRTANKMFSELQQHKRIQCLMLKLRSNIQSRDCTRCVAAALRAQTCFPRTCFSRFNRLFTTENMAKRLLRPFDKRLIAARSLFVYF